MRRKKILTLILLTWLPLLLLNYWFGPAGDEGFYSLGQDLSVHVRLLITLPVFLVLEKFYIRRIDMLIEETKQVLPEQFDAHFRLLTISNKPLSSSKYVIAAIILAVFLIIFFTRIQSENYTNSWVFTSVHRFSLAGWWYYLISMPIFLFYMLRWIIRWLLWAYFVYRLSKAPLNLIPEHADRMAGLEYLSFVPEIFSLVFTGLAAVVSSLIAMEVQIHQVPLASYYFDIAAFCILGTLIIYFPLLFFLPLLNEVKIKGIKDYGSLIREHHLHFRKKWFGQSAPGEILGSPDASSKADIDGSYAPLQELRPFPMSKKILINSLIFTIIPFFPLVFLRYSFGEVIQRLLDVMLGW